MRIIRHIENIPEKLRGGAVAVGNFDGMHRGHQALIQQCRAMADAVDGPAVALTFEPHPRSLFQADAPPFRLTPFRSKARLLADLGVDCLTSLRFDRKVSQQPAEDFIKTVLVEGLGARHVIVGQDFRFGRLRSGDTALLQARAEKGGYSVIAVAPVASADAEIYSSTHIREQVEAGKPGHAAAMLGRPFEIEGVVETGDQRGRTLGFPTANIDIGDYIRPARGVYAVRAGIDKGEETVWVDGVANFGNRPTIGGNSLLLETHLFDFSGDLYGQTLRVALIEYLRPERKFDGLDALKAQIDEDSATARRILKVRAAGAS